MSNVVGRVPAWTPGVAGAALAVSAVHEGAGLALLTAAGGAALVVAGAAVAAAGAGLAAGAAG